MLAIWRLPSVSCFPSLMTSRDLRGQPRLTRRYQLWVSRAGIVILVGVCQCGNSSIEIMCLMRYGDNDSKGPGRKMVYINLAFGEAITGGDFQSF